ncbi:DUF6252 family protein [Flavobacterium daemonense]|uniref:DUF6252 family protein n=1 Tax=Flavobacterium daemonense TaxID=1393049 RepID=UPI00118611F8|nr:DUF6252 family protein [Flavobacterium daemonense]KAF2336200.1 hypothetical protein FND99_02655 [Flavobacterium daemonense]
MKKHIYFLLLLFVAVSCTEDIKFNNPAFQGLKDNVFWRAATYKASRTTTGDIVIEGALGFEKVILRLPYDEGPGKTMVLGIDNVTIASYLNTFPGKSAEFSTGENKGSGQIVITNIGDENTISGTFKFTAINNDATDTENPKVTFTEGVFYKIPITSTLEY